MQTHRFTFNNCAMPHPVGYFGWALSIAEQYWAAVLEYRNKTLTITIRKTFFVFVCRNLQMVFPWHLHIAQECYVVFHVGSNLILFYYFKDCFHRRIILQNMQKGSEKFNYFLFCRLKYKSKKNSLRNNLWQKLDWILREFVTKQFDKNQLFSCKQASPFEI